MLPPAMPNRVVRLLRVLKARLAKPVHRSNRESLRVSTATTPLNRPDAIA